MIKCISTEVRGWLPELQHDLSVQGFSPLEIVNEEIVVKLEIPDR